VKTLAEAIAELEAMENPEEELEKINNRDWPSSRCMSCPVATFLHLETGKRVWVNVHGSVYIVPSGMSYPFFGGAPDGQLSEKLVRLINRFDNQIWENR
jgi:hypothetical protein